VEGFVVRRDDQLRHVELDAGARASDPPAAGRERPNVVDLARSAPKGRKERVVKL